MSKYNYEINLSEIESKDAYKEATREELQILLSIIARDGKFDSKTALANAVGLSKIRVTSALTLWEESGVLNRVKASDWDSLIPTPVSNSASEIGTEYNKSKYPESEIGISYEPKIIDEFKDNIFREELYEEKSIDVANAIRDENLAGVIEECAKFMGKAQLNTQETKHIVELNTQLALSPVYILNLSAHLATKGHFTPKKLADKAYKLVNIGVDNEETLNNYIKEQESQSAYEMEYRNVLGIYNRSLSSSEKEYFRRWSTEYDYSAVIVGLAYDITVNNTGKISYAYMNKLLKLWHESNCKTLSDCQAFIEKSRAEKEADKNKKNSNKKKQEPAKVAKFTEFNSEDAMLKALARSYGEEK